MAAAVGFIKFLSLSLSLAFSRFLSLSLACSLSRSLSHARALLLSLALPFPLMSGELSRCFGALPILLNPSLPGGTLERGAGVPRS